MTPLQPAGAGPAADEVVTLIGRDHEQRVLPGDAVGGQPGEEGAERCVLFPQLLFVPGLGGQGPGRCVSVLNASRASPGVSK